MSTQTDPSKSNEYRKALEEYATAEIVDSQVGFCCAHGDRCRSSVSNGNDFAAGQLSYVGDGYAAAVDGTPVRILVVSMQVGDAEAPVLLGRRREQIHARIAERFGQRNPHMRGVTLALEVLLGLEPGTDAESLSDGVHVLDAYAMANSVLCSNLPTGGRSRRGSPTAAMLANCRTHLRRTVELLEPTIIHSQGRTKSGESTHSAFLSAVDSCEWIDDHVAIVSVGDVVAVWCSLGHPSAGPPNAWSWPAHNHFREVVEPALRRTRELAGLS